MIGVSYVLGIAPMTLRTHCWAAALDAGPSAVISGPTALALHGIATRESRIHLSSTRLRPRRAEVVIHQESVGPGEIVLDEDGLLVAERLRALADTLRWLPLEEAQQVLDEALRRRWVDVDWLVQQAHRFAGRRGGPQLTALVQRNAAGGVGEGERILHTVLRRAGISGWRANVPVMDEHGLVGYGDVVFVDVPLVLEADGQAHHTDARRFQRDRTRQNRLVNAGYVVLRFTWADLTERPADVVAQVLAALNRLKADRAS